MNTAAATIPEDLACVSCGYNLRTLAVGGRCPECGLAVGVTIERRDGSNARDHLLHRRRGVAALLALQAGNWLFLGAALAFPGSAANPSPIPGLGGVLLLDIQGLMITVALLMEAGGGRSAVGLRTLRRATAGFVGATLIILVGFLPILSLVPPGFSHVLSMAPATLLAGVRLAALSLLVRTWATGRRARARDALSLWTTRLGWTEVLLALLAPCLATGELGHAVGYAALITALLTTHAALLMLLIRDWRRLRLVLAGRLR